MTSSVISTKSFSTPAPVVSANAPYAWIIDKNFDFLFVCGGAVWILIAINYFFLGWTVPISATFGDPLARFLMVIILIGQHISADSHTAATYLRIYGSKEDRRRFHFHGKWLALSCIPIFIAGINVPGLAGAFVYIYLLTVFWHYAAQTFGVSLIYCYKQGYFLNSKEKEIYRSFILSMSSLILVRLMT